MVTRQLSTLIGAGFPLVSAIYTLVPQAGSQALKKILSKIKDSIEEGKSFAGALSICAQPVASTMDRTAIDQSLLGKRVFIRFNSNWLTGNKDNVGKKSLIWQVQQFRAMS